MMKPQTYMMLGFLLFTFLATLGLTGQDIPKTEQWTKDFKPPSVSKWAWDMWKSLADLSEPDENLLHLVVLLRSKPTIVQRDTLKGFHGMRVVVEDVRPEAEKYGLTKEALQTDTELRLRQYGIKVLSLEESARSLLYINVNALVAEPPMIAAVAVQVEFQQEVLLYRDLKTRVVATTWDKGRVICGAVTILKNVRETVKDLVDEFINDYLAVNPKEQPSAEKDSKVKE